MRVRKSTLAVMAVVAVALVCVGLAIWFSKTADDTRESAAKAQVKVLTQTCEAYRISHGYYPHSLQALLQHDEIDGPHLKSADAIIDPWKQPYQYNQSGPNNGGWQPDIWATAPSGTQIGNWAPPGPVDATVTAEQLLTEYQANANDAEIRYRGKRMEVRGALGKLELAHGYVTLESRDQLQKSSVQCWLKDVRSFGRIVPSLRPNQVLKVYGVCKGKFFGEVMLEKCEIKPVVR